MKILVLGGTKFLGPAIVEAALKKDHTITLFNRGRTNPHLFPDVEKLKGDRNGKLQALEGRRWDAVIDTSGYVPRIVKLSAELLAPNVRQTRTDEESATLVRGTDAYGHFRPEPNFDEDFHAEAVAFQKKTEALKHRVYDNTA